MVPDVKPSAETHETSAIVKHIRKIKVFYTLVTFSSVFTRDF